MRIHILGICGTSWGLAMLALASLGHEVTGSTPMCIQADEYLYLRSKALIRSSSYDASQPRSARRDLGDYRQRDDARESVRGSGAGKKHSLYVWSIVRLHDFVLRDRWVLRGRRYSRQTTTAGMATDTGSAGTNRASWIGGVPGNSLRFPRARARARSLLSKRMEYDCAAPFDKRSKFVHYCPRTLILNNLEFDHAADIFDDPESDPEAVPPSARIVPGQGRIIWPENDINLKQTTWRWLLERAGAGGRAGTLAGEEADYVISGVGSVWLDGEKVGDVKWGPAGEHNMHNGLMAIAAARHVGRPRRSGQCAGVIY